MPQPRCSKCGLPVSIHFGWCYSSGIRGNVPKEALSLNAIKFERGELKQPSLLAYLAKHGKRA